MGNTVVIPKKLAETVKWAGDGVKYDHDLYNLGNGSDEFIIVNPDYDYLRLINFTIPDYISDKKCIVWEYNGIWVAKYFKNTWDGKGYHKILLDLNSHIKWEYNDDLGIRFKPTPITDLNDLQYQLVWYLDSKFNPTKEKIWAVRGQLINFESTGTKEMGTLGPDIIYNPALPKLEYSITDIVPWYDLNYEHIWMLDKSLSNSKEKVWAARILPLGKSNGTKFMGNINIKLPSQLDVIFIKYNEPNADENWERLLSIFPNAKRVINVPGIVAAHRTAALMSTTDMFYVVDGDAYISDDFNFKFQPGIWDRDCVHVWNSINPVNDLKYGYGGVKLIPKELMLQVESTVTDMTTSISKKFKLMPEVSNITAFNTDEYSTWRSAFRECAKLALQDNKEAQHRLNVWCTTGADKRYGEWAIKGAITGKEYGINHPDEINRINDFTWLQNMFNKYSL